jgi:hypothetical protein
LISSNGERERVLKRKGSLSTVSHLMINPIKNPFSGENMIILQLSMYCRKGKWGIWKAVKTAMN